MNSWDEYPGHYVKVNYSLVQVDKSILLHIITGLGLNVQTGKGGKDLLIKLGVPKDNIGLNVLFDPQTSNPEVNPVVKETGYRLSSYFIEMELNGISVMFVPLLDNVESKFTPKKLGVELFWIHTHAEILCSIGKGDEIVYKEADVVKLLNKLGYEVDFDINTVDFEKWVRE